MENKFAPQIQAGNYTLAPAGAHVGRCCQAIYLGHHKETYQGQDKGWVPKCRIGWELPLKKHIFHPDKGAEPFMIGLEYSYLFGEKAKLRLHLESLRGKKYTPESIAKFDLRKLIGFTAQITVVHETKSDGRKIAKIANVTPLIEGMEVPPAILPVQLYSVLEGRSSPTFPTLAQWLQEKCSQCKEWMPPDPEEVAAEEAGAETPLAEEEDKDNSPF